jgi:hypothetical protein
VARSLKKPRIFHCEQAAMMSSIVHYSTAFSMS